MTAQTVSVIVVSRGRPDALVRCLTGIQQLYHPAFEAVVVADAAGLAALAAAGVAERIKTVEFAEPNISAARNLGLQQAAGDIVAFIDDDAVPEPTWLRHLTAPFQDDAVAAAGGYVRGRNGISFQHTARRVDGCGRHAALPVTGDAAQVFDAAPGRAIKTEGTNCAFRRGVLLDIGGFDPAFRFYMDETDVNLRLAESRHKTAIVPLAQVHHGFAASDRRHASRLPRTLADIGASQMVLLRKHASQTDPGPVLNRVRADQRARLLRHMVAGTCEPRDVTALLATLEAGIAEGRTRATGPLNPLRPSGAGFMPLQRPVAYRGSVHLAGRIWQRSRLRARATELLRSGQRVSLFLFSPTALFHKVEFSTPGVWEQRGGLWGRSLRTDPLVSPWRFAARLAREVDRVRPVRDFTN